MVIRSVWFSVQCAFMLRSGNFYLFHWKILLHWPQKCVRCHCCTLTIGGKRRKLVFYVRDPFKKLPQKLRRLQNNSTFEFVLRRTMTQWKNMSGIRTHDLHNLLLKLINNNSIGACSLTMVFHLTIWFYLHPPTCVAIRNEALYSLLTKTQI